MLESTTTDNDGLFWFFGKNYTDRKTISIKNGTIQTDNGTKLASGYLGKGKGYTSIDTATQDLGDLFLNGATFEIIVNLENNYNGTYYDSVTCTSQYKAGDLFGIFRDTVNGLFTKNLGYQSSQTKQFGKSQTYPINDHKKFNFHAYYNFYKNGVSNITLGRGISCWPCTSDNTITFCFPE